MVGVRVSLAAKVLAGLQNLIEQSAPHRQDCADGPLLGLQDGAARIHDPRPAPHAAADHTHIYALVGALSYA